MFESQGLDRMNRRSFFGTLAAAGLGTLGLAGCASAGPAGAASGRFDKVGVQLYTVRDRMRNDVAPTLQAVSSVGYREVETAGFNDFKIFGLAPQEFRAAMDRSGLVSPAGHYPLSALRENLDATLATARALGQQWVVVPSISESERTLSGFRRVAQDLNRFGAAAREQGLRVAYHNHDFEFKPLEGGRTGYDILLAETDPALVDMELDLFWTVKAGHDPVTLFNRHPGRFPLWHVKDMADQQGAQRMVSVGEGEIDFGRIFASAQQAGLKHFFVEHDNPQDSLVSIRNSYRHVEQLLSL